MRACMSCGVVCLYLVNEAHIEVSRLCLCSSVCRVSVVSATVHEVEMLPCSWPLVCCPVLGMGLQSMFHVVNARTCDSPSTQPFLAARAAADAGDRVIRAAAARPRVTDGHRRTTHSPGGEHQTFCQVAIYDSSRHFKSNITHRGADLLLVRVEMPAPCGAVSVR